MKVQFVSQSGEGTAHWATHSGYDRLPTFFHGAQQPQKIVFRRPTGIYGLVTELPRLAARKLVTRSAGSWYSLSSFARIELRVARQWLLNQGVVFHLLHGEAHFRYLGYLTKRLRTNRLVATFHLPITRLTELMPNPYWLSNLDAVIAMGRRQAAWLAQWTNVEKVHFVPHGVDIDFFSPMDRSNCSQTGDHSYRCLFVGAHLRNFDMLREVICQVNAGPMGGEVNFDLVVLPAHRAGFAGMPHVTLHDRLSDEALRTLYQHAELLLQPMKDCVANNSILEGMACGTPIVATDVGDIRDYVDEFSGMFVRAGDSPAMAEVVTQLLTDQQRLRKMRNAARQQAEVFSWERTVAQLYTVYKDLWEPQ